MRAGKQAKQTAVELGVNPVTLSNWIRQDDIGNARRPGVPSSELAELHAAKRRIRELETELVIVRQSAKLLDEERRHPNDSFPMIDRLADAGIPIDRCCRVLGSPGSTTTA